MDAAGPLFEKTTKDVRIDKSDASFVDLIHSNGGNEDKEGLLIIMDFFFLFFNPRIVGNLDFQWYNLHNSKLANFKIEHEWRFSRKFVIMILVETRLDRDIKRLKSKFLYAVLEQWIFEDFRGLSLA